VLKIKFVELNGDSCYFVMYQSFGAVSCCDKNDKVMFKHRVKWMLDLYSPKIKFVLQILMHHI
jgi:hypothetical protein